MMYRGRLAFFGPPEEALRHFEVRRLHEVYDLLEKTPKPEYWADRFTSAECWPTYVGDRLKPAPAVEVVETSSEIIVVSSSSMEDVPPVASPAAWIML